MKKLLGCSFLLIILVAVGQAWSANITVDGSTCTLADAITAANTNGDTGGCTGSGAAYGDDTITLQTDVLLTASLPEITSTITIEGQGHTIDGNNDQTVGSVLGITDGGNLTLNESIITGGNQIKAGGGVYNKNGTVTLNNSMVRGNRSYVIYAPGYTKGDPSGGGIYNNDSGIINLNGSIVRENSTGGGLGVSGYGGGILNHGTMTLIDSVVSDNVANLGGGICNSSLGTITLTRSTISNNTIISLGFGGGIDNRGIVTLNNSTVSGNTIKGSSWNPYSSGGGIYNSHIATLNNSTVSGNTVINGFAGGIDNAGTVTLNNSTVSDNAGENTEIYSVGGILTSGTCILHSSLVSGNTARDGVNEVRNDNNGTINADSHNVLGHDNETDVDAFYDFTPGGSDVNATSDGTDPTSLKAILAPLANNGGPTQTHALIIGSPAIDLDTECSAGLNKDQRGEARPNGLGCDAGSFEGSIDLLNSTFLPAVYMLLL